MRPAAILNILVRAETKAAQANLMRQDAQLRRTAKTAVTASQTVGRASSAAATQAANGAKKGVLALALTGAAVGKLSIDFDKSMRNVNSIAQLPERTFQRLEKRVLKLAGPTAQAPRTLAEGLYTLVSSGFDADDSMKILAKSAKAATAGLTTTEVSTKAVAAVLNAYRMPASRAGKVSDQLFRTVDRGVISFESLAENVGDVLPFAASLHVGLDQVGASIATMTKAGISAPETMTRIKAVMVSILKPNEDLAKAIKKTGFESGEALIRQKGFQGGLETLIRTTDGSKASVAKLFPNIRALGGALALTGDNAAGANKDLKGMRDSAGATDRALSQQSKSIALQWQRLKAKGAAVAIEFGQKVLPKITEVFNVLTDPKLTGEQKLQRIRDMINDALQSGVDAAAKYGPRIAGSLAAGFVSWWFSANPLMKVLGTVAIIRLLGGRGAIGATGATIGKWLFGGIAAGAAGRGGGGAAGGGAAAGAAGGLLGGIRGKLLGAAGRAGLLAIGLSAGDAVLSGMGRAVDAQSSDLFKSLKARSSNVGPAAFLFDALGKSASQQDAETVLKTLERIRDKNGRINADQADQARSAARFLDLTRKQKAEMERLLNTGLVRDNRVRAVQNEFDRMRKGSILSVRELRQVTSSNFRAIASDLGVNSRKGKDAVQTNFRLGLRVIRGFVRDGTLTTAQGSKEIARLLKVHTGAGKDSVRKNFFAARTAIANAVGGSVKITDKGAGAIRRIFARELALYGFSKESIKFRLQGKDFTGKNVGAGSEGNLAVSKQRGGPITWGAPTGDSVPAMLEKGEYVLNRKAVQKLGIGALDRVNFAGAPRFQAGGMVDPAWDPGNERLAASISGKVGAWARRYQANMTAGYDPGGGHVSPGHNITGTATDMVPLGGNWDLLEKGLRVLVGAGLKVLYGSNGVGTPFPNHGRGNHAHIEWGGAAGLPGFNPKIARMRIAGPDSPLTAIAQGALDQTRAAAQRQLNDLVGASFADGTGGVNFAGGTNSARNRHIGQRMAGRRGWGRGAEWRALDDLWGRLEGSWDENLFNMAGSGAYGIAQALPASKYPPAGQPSAPPGAKKAAAQIGWGLDYIGGRYTDPLGAHAARVAKGWYQEGGIVSMLKTGGLAGLMNRAVNTVGGLNKKGKRFPAKRRSKALHKFLDRIKGLGLPGKLDNKIKTLTHDAEVYGDFASRAGALTLEGPNGEQILGKVGGETEADWLGQQLSTLFELRNKLIRAHEIVVRKRDAMTKLIGRGQKRLNRLADTIRKAARKRHGLEKELHKARKHPSKNRNQIRGLRGKIRDIDRAQGVRTRERDLLHNRILPALGNKRSSLNTSRGDILQSIDDVQGIGSPMEKLTALPAVGVLGGQIFDVQMRLRELGTKPAITDTSTDGSERADLLAGINTDLAKQLAVSRGQYGVFGDFAGMFAKGGHIPAGMWGIAGEIGPEVVRGPATVHSASDTAAALQPHVEISFADGMGWLAEFVDVRVNGQQQKAVSKARRRPSTGVR